MTRGRAVWPKGSTHSLRRFRQDALLRNSLYLTLNTAMVGAVGFVFWLINSHLYSPVEIGTATTLISAASLISYVSLFGFNTTFIRFLPTSQDPNSEMNTGLLIVFGTAALVATAFVLLVPSMAPKLMFVRDSLGFTLGFVVMTAFWAVNLVTDSVFIAYRKAQYNILCDGFILGAVKLTVPFVAVSLGAFGIFTSSGLSVTVGVAASVYFMVKIADYRPRPALSQAVLRRTWQYSAANYVANLLALAPLFVIQLILLNVQGPRQAGYFFIAFQVTSLLYAVGYALSQSLFAEGSRADANLPALVRRSVKVLVLISVPTALLVAAAGRWLLLPFGQSYSLNAGVTMAVLALSAPSVGFFAVAATVLRIAKLLRVIIVANAIYAAVIVTLTILFASRGLPWVALAWLVGNTVAGAVAAAYAVVWLRDTPIHQPEAAVRRVQPR
jgi:O-antigen/teichoic acid export membrane protein